MRFRCANSISMRFLSRRDCSNASVLASARLTGQNLSPRSVRVGGDDRVRTQCVSLLVPSKEAADCNHQQDAGEANRKLHRNVVADGGQQDLAELSAPDPAAEHL